MITRLDTLFSFNFFLKIHKPCVQAEKNLYLTKNFLCFASCFFNLYEYFSSHVFMFKSFIKMHKIRLMEINIICHDMFG